MHKRHVRRAIRRRAPAAQPIVDAAPHRYARRRPRHRDGVDRCALSMPPAAAIKTVLAASPFHGEGHRKVWAWLRYAGIRTSLRRCFG